MEGGPCPPKGRKGKALNKNSCCTLDAIGQPERALSSQQSTPERAIPHISLSLSLSSPKCLTGMPKKRQGENVPAEKMRPCQCWGCWQIMSSLGRWPHGKQPLQFRRPKEWRPKVCRGGRASFEVFVAAICIPRSIF